MFVQHTLCRTSLAGLNFSFLTRAAKCAFDTPGYPPDATSFCKALARLCRRVWCSCRCGIRADETAERVDPEPPVVFAVPAPPLEPFPSDRERGLQRSYELCEQKGIVGSI